LLSFRPFLTLCLLLRTFNRFACKRIGEKHDPP